MSRIDTMKALAGRDPAYASLCLSSLRENLTDTTQEQKEVKAFMEYLEAINSRSPDIQIGGSRTFT